MKNSAKFSFTDWLASKQAVSFSLGVGLFFLIHLYQEFNYLVSPHATGHYVLPEGLVYLLSYAKATFFGLTTIILIFQTNQKVVKLTYISFECIMVFLVLGNETFVSIFGESFRFVLYGYIAVFSACSIYFLGVLAKEHREKEMKEKAELEAKEQAQKERLERHQEEKAKLQKALAETQAQAAKEKAELEQALKEAAAPTPSKNNLSEEEKSEEEKALQEAQEILKNTPQKTRVKNKAPKNYTRAKKHLDKNPDLSIGDIENLAGVSRDTARRIKRFYQENNKH